MSLCPMFWLRPINQLHGIVINACVFQQSLDQGRPESG
jgi:hypothetical protein